MRKRKALISIEMGEVSLRRGNGFSAETKHIMSHNDTKT
jgi:hypothetical protein